MGNGKEVSQPPKRILLKGLLGAGLMIGGASVFESQDSQNNQQKTTTNTSSSLESKEQEIFIYLRPVIKNFSILVFSLGAYVGFKNFWQMINHKES